MVKFTEKRISRRTALKGTIAAAGAAVGASIGGFPTVWAQDIKDIEIRMVGTAVTFSKTYEAMVTEALGFKCSQTAVPLSTITQRAITQPKSADLFEPDLEQFIQVFPAGTMQAIDIRRLEHYDALIGIYKKIGKIG